MNPVLIFSKLLDCFHLTRQAGSTTILEMAANNSGLLIIAPTEDAAKHIEKSPGIARKSTEPRAISLHRFWEYMQGRKPRPWALDNYTVKWLCDLALGQFAQDVLAIKLRDASNKALSLALLQADKELKAARHLISEYSHETRAQHLQLEEYKHEVFKLKTRLAVRKIRSIKVRRK